MINHNQKQPLKQEKFKLEEEKSDDDSTNATFEISSQIIKVPYLTLLQRSRIVQAEFRQGDIFERLSAKLKDIQKKNKIDDDIILTFFRLLNNEEVELKPEEITHLLMLTDLFKIDSLKRGLQNYIQKHVNDVEFILSLKISQEAIEDDDENLFSEDVFSAEMEKCLSENINECLANEKLAKIHVSSIYRMIEKSCIGELNSELLFRFISESIEDRHILLRFVQVDKLNDESFALFYDNYKRDMKEQNSDYYDYLPNNINYIIQLRTKQQTLEKQIKTLEDKLNKCEIESKNRNDELTKINQEIKTQLNDTIKQKDDEIFKLNKFNQELRSKKRAKYSFEVIKELLSKYGNINEFEVSGENILHYAVRSNNQYLVEYILSLKVIDVNTETSLDLLLPDDYGYTALHFACQNNNIEIVKLLLETPNIDVNIQTKKLFGLKYPPPEGEYTALHFACQNNNIEIVKLLLGTPNIDVNIQTDYGYTALHFACQNNNNEIVKLLLGTANIDVNIQTKPKLDYEEGYTALHFACQNNNIEIIKLLLGTANIDVNIQTKYEYEDDYGYTALHFACQNNNIEIVKLLLETPNIDVNIQTKYDDDDDDDRYTALHFACQNNNIEIVKLLLKNKKIDLNQTNGKGKLPIDLTNINEIKSLISTNMQ